MDRETWESHFVRYISHFLTVKSIPFREGLRTHSYPYSLGRVFTSIIHPSAREKSWTWAVPYGSGGSPRQVQGEEIFRFPRETMEKSLLGETKNTKFPFVKFPEFACWLFSSPLFQSVPSTWQ